jgi:hypothetical protein
MTFKNLFIEHELSPEIEAWIKEEVDEQEQRYRAVSNDMDNLAPMREKWYQEFFDRITTSGFNEDGDAKTPIKPEHLPVKPEGRNDQVIWKYGIDDE